MTYSLFIGRWQPLHAGHVAIIRRVLDEGKNVCIGIRDTPEDGDNPYSHEDRYDMFWEEFADEMVTGRLHIIEMPDVTEVCHGRAPGWTVRQIEVDEETALISGTEIRKCQV